MGKELTPSRLIEYIISLGGLVTFTADTKSYHTAFHTLQQENGGCLVGEISLAFCTAREFPYSERLEEIMSTLVGVDLIRMFGFYHDASSSTFLIMPGGNAEHALKSEHADHIEEIMALAWRFAELISAEEPSVVSVYNERSSEVQS